jgi:KDO2-lipid IV(A) lauroyltransferase
MSLTSLRHRLEYFAFRLIACLLAILSVRQTVRCGEALGWLLTRPALRKLARYHVARDNLRQAYGDSLSDREIDNLIRRLWVHLFRLVAELVQLPRKMTLTNCREVIVFRNRRPVLEALCSGRPVFILGGHFGNWEVSTATFGLFGFPMGIVAREMDNPYLHRWFFETRQQFGHKLFLKRGGFEGMAELMQAGGNLGLLCDQDAGHRGVFVDFFGRPASTFKSIALMALEYKALIVVGYGIRLPDDFVNARWVRYEIGCEEVIDPLTFEYNRDTVTAITQRYTAALERAIRRAPEQYFWIHRRWKTEPGQTARSRKQSKVARRAA